MVTAEYQDLCLYPPQSPVVSPCLLSEKPQRHSEYLSKKLKSHPLVCNSKKIVSSFKRKKNSPILQ